MAVSTPTSPHTTGLTREMVEAGAAVAHSRMCYAVTRADLEAIYSVMLRASPKVEGGELVERVARAIYETGLSCEPFDDLNAATREVMLAKAIAALEASGIASLQSNLDAAREALKLCEQRFRLHGHNGSADEVAAVLAEIQSCAEGDRDGA